MAFLVPHGGDTRFCSARAAAAWAYREVAEHTCSVRTVRPPRSTVATAHACL